MTRKRALLIVDVQNDFVEGGTLAVPGGRTLADKITDYLRGVQDGPEADRYALVVASRDHHNPTGDNGGHFAAPGTEPDYATTWPRHCVGGTPGADYVDGLDLGPVDVHIIKGMGSASYSAFDGVTDDENGFRLDTVLAEDGITDLDIVGIAKDFCVRASALDAAKAGLSVRVLDNLTVSVSLAGSAESDRQLDEAGIDVTSAARPTGAVVQPLAKVFNELGDRTSGIRVVGRDVAQEPVAPEGYSAHDYEPFALTVDLAIFTVRDGAFKVLLVERGHEPYAGRWALPGGFVQPDENAETAALRELKEETAITDAAGAFHLEQLKTYSEPGRDPRMRVVSVAHVAFAPGLDEPTAGDDAADARWWSVVDAIEMGLAFDHDTILADAVERVRSKLEYTTLATSFVRPPFSISELRDVYTAVWGAAPPLGNFRRKVLSTEGFVLPAGPAERGSSRGGPRPLLFTAGDATTLQPAMLRPVPGEDLDQE